MLESPIIQVKHIPRVTTDEVLQIAQRVGTNKAPGPDRILNSALKAAIKEDSEPFAQMLQSCFRRRNVSDTLVEAGISFST